MPKKTWTINGFAGGLNTDSDLSDLRSESGEASEVAELNNLFLDDVGKVHGKIPIASAAGLTVASQTSGAQGLLYHNDQLYNESGVYKIGDDVNWSGLSTYQSIDVGVAGSGEHDITPEEETIAPDIKFAGVRKTGSASNWEEVILCLGKNSPYNPYGDGFILPLTDNDTTLDWAESKVRAVEDDDDNGSPDKTWFAENPIIGDINPFDSGADETVTEQEVHSENYSGGGYDTETNLWDHWIAVTSEDFALGTDAGATLSNVVDLKGAEADSTDVSNFDHFQQYHSNHGEGDDSNDHRTWLTFRVGTGNFSNQTGEDENGAFGTAMPNQIVGKDLIVDVKLNNSASISELRIVLLGRNDNDTVKTSSFGEEQYSKVWSIGLGTLLAEGALTDYVRLRLPWASAFYTGSNFDESSINMMFIMPRYSANPNFTTAVNSWRVREVAFVPPIQEGVGFTNKYYILSQTRVTDAGIESIPYDIPDDGGTPGTSAGKITLIPSEKAQLTVYKPNISSVVGKGNIYYQEVTKDGAPLSDRFLLAQWHEDDGVRPATDTTGNYTAWDTSTTPDQVVLEFEDPPVSSTYTLESGYPEGTENIDALWQDAAVVGRTAYIGYVKQPTSAGSFNTTLILKSAIGKVAGFPNLQYIDVEFGGSGITHMTSIGDRLFVFSAAQMVVINVAQDIEFVEAQFPNLGVAGSAQVSKIGEGLVIVNQSGVYLFDGNSIKDIKSEKNKNIAIHATCAVGYVAKLKYIMVWGWDNDDNDVAVYSVKTQSWVGRINDTLDYPTSEVIPGNNGVAYYARGTSEYVLGDRDTDSGADKSTVLRTGKISMGDIARNKKFYKLYVNTTNATGYTLYWSTTDVASWTSASASLSDGTNEIKLSGAAGKYIMLKLVGTNARPDFELGELSIIYREKSVK